VNRRLFFAGFLGTPVWTAAPIRVSRYDGSPEVIHPSEHTATVLLFLSTLCPISNAYSERIQSLVASHRAQPVRWILIDSNENESAGDAREYARAAGLPLPLHKDWRNVVADRYGATLTPEAVLLDASGRVRYRGAIDDARNPARVRTHGLRSAIDAVLAGKPVDPASLRAFGCAIKRVPRT
jgi:hypothetical protein